MSFLSDRDSLSTINQDFITMRCCQFSSATFFSHFQRLNTRRVLKIFEICFSFVPMAVSRSEGLQF